MDSSTDRNGLIVFVRNPTFGNVKSRIAKLTGNLKALEIYNELLLQTKELCLQVPEIQSIIFYSEIIEYQDDWAGPYFKKALQQGGDLGERMSHAIKEGLKDFAKILLIGSDCPYLNKEIIRKGFDKLKENDLVIGPASDGGYYLIGSKKYYPELFQQIDWGTGQVFKQTVQKAAHLKLFILPELSDIDEYNDYIKWKSHIS